MTKTKIEWCDSTWNPISGCPGTKISPGCKNCYAERMATRLRGRCGYNTSEPFMVTYHEERLKYPLEMAKPRRIFVCSMGDLFHEDVEPDFIDEIFAVMAMCPQHEFVVLTKRVDRMSSYLSDPRDGYTMLEALDFTDIWSEVGCEVEQDYKVPNIFAYNRLCRLEKGLEDASRVIKEQRCLPNVRLMVTICNQDEANRKLPLLLSIPGGWKLGVSIEPMLGPVDMTNIDADANGHPDWCWINALSGRHDDMGRPCLDVPKLDWVICGAETGPKARPMHPDWVRSLRDQCQEAGVPFFFKGMTENGRKTRLLDGREWSEVPV